MLYRALFGMAAFYGLRRSEIVGLKWNAIDFENKKIIIQHTVVTAKVNGTVTEIARDKVSSANAIVSIFPENAKV